MALLTVEVFALATDSTRPLTAEQQFHVHACFTDALARLNEHTTPEVRLLSWEVTPYGTGAVIHLLSLAPCAEQLTDAVAQHLATEMATDTTSTLFAGWELAAGHTLVLCGDN